MILMTMAVQFLVVAVFGFFAVSTAHPFHYDAELDALTCESYLEKLWRKRKMDVKG